MTAADTLNVEPPAKPVERDLWESLNRTCFCLSLDRSALAKALDAEAGTPGLAALVEERCPHLFAAQPVFLPAKVLNQVREVVRAVEAVVSLEAYRADVLTQANVAAQVDAGPRSVFFGYDFHVQGDEVGLIEINTNAGGAMLNAVMARAQRACCPDVSDWMLGAEAGRRFESDIVSMFQSEWRLAGRTAPLRTVAVVDTAPTEQYLYPEFLLFQQLLTRQGMEVVIADPATLSWREGRLWAGEWAIDLVYNRLTDFALVAPESQTLREAYLAGAIVLTPHPRAHALYADKRRLILFSDREAMDALRVPAWAREVLLAHVPLTEVLDPAEADRFWAARKGLFFKPVAGYGSRAAYRGEKLTKGTWQSLLSGDVGGYVAQALVRPGERWLGSSEAPQAYKYDLRAYVYDGAVQWVAARLYQGQATNFRTEGGGFSPVFFVPDLQGWLGPA